MRMNAADIGFNRNISSLSLGTQRKKFRLAALSQTDTVAISKNAQALGALRSRMASEKAGAFPAIENPSSNPIINNVNKLGNQLGEAKSILERMKAISKLAQDESITFDDEFDLSMEYVSLRGELGKIGKTGVEQQAIDADTQEQLARIARIRDILGSDGTVTMYNHEYYNQLAEEYGEDFFKEGASADYFAATSAFVERVKAATERNDLLHKELGLEEYKDKPPMGIFEKDRIVSTGYHVGPLSNEKSRESSVPEDLGLDVRERKFVSVYESLTAEQQFDRIVVSKYSVEEYVDAGDGRFYKPVDLEMFKENQKLYYYGKDLEAFYNSGADIGTKECAVDAIKKIDVMLADVTRQYDELVGLANGLNGESDSALLQGVETRLVGIAKFLTHDLSTFSTKLSTKPEKPFTIVTSNAKDGIVKHLSVDDHFQLNSIYNSTVKFLSKIVEYIDDGVDRGFGFFPGVDE